jgi:hypothetical protein
MIVDDSLGSSVIRSMPGWMYLAMCVTDAIPPHAMIFSMLRGWYSTLSIRASPPFQ